MIFSLRGRDLEQRTAGASAQPPRGSARNPPGPHPPGRNLFFWGGGWFSALAGSQGFSSQGFNDFPNTPGTPTLGEYATPAQPPQPPPLPYPSEQV